MAIIREIHCILASTLGAAFIFSILPIDPFLNQQLLVMIVLFELIHHLILIHTKKCHKYYLFRNFKKAEESVKRIGEEIEENKKEIEDLTKELKRLEEEGAIVLKESTEAQVQNMLLQRKGLEKYGLSTSK